MPLSEEENRLLEQMERALAAEDPKLASAMRGRTLERSAKIRTSLAAVAFIIGIAGLMGGAVSGHIWLSVLGFVVMLASATIGLAAWRGRHASANHQEGQAGAPAADAESGDHERWTVIQGGRRPRRGKSGDKQRKPRRQGGSRQHGNFMQRMEQRWERRRNQGY